MRLHGLYPPLDRCGHCAARLPAGVLRYHSPVQGFVCGDCVTPVGPPLGPDERRLLDEIFRRPPGGLSNELRALPLAPLESFHQGLIAAHLERGLPAQRVLRDLAREMRA